MKLMLKTSALVGFGLLLTSGSASAGTVEATVPFPFTVGTRVLPPGQYRVERDMSDPTILMIQGEHGVHAAAITQSTEAPGHDPAGHQAALVFTRGESGYRLKDVWESRDTGRELPAR